MVNSTRPISWWTRILASGAVAGCMVCTPIQAAWRYHDFEIYAGTPHPGGIAFEEINDLGLDMASDALDSEFGDSVRKMQVFLHDAAVEYDRMGFPDPVAAGVLGPINTNWFENDAIRVYLLDLTKFNKVYADAENPPLAVYANPCDGNLPAWSHHKILLHRPLLLQGNHVMDYTYETLAHELFHAVQMASRYRAGANRCKVGKWVQEGSAAAMGFDMGRKLRQLSFRESNVKPNFLKVWGGRHYYDPLPDADLSQQDDYFSGSFWRHLAELKATGEHPGSAKAPVDYTYLVSLFAQPLNGSGHDAELRWIDGWMKSHAPFSKGLQATYAQFTSTIADFMSTRIPKIRKLAENDRERLWLKKLFKQCPEAHLSRANPRDMVTLDVERNAARCFTLYVDEGGYTPYQVVIENSNLSKDKQKQLFLSYSGGQLVKQADPHPVGAPYSDAGTSYTKWQFLTVTEIPNQFILSNMARDPGNTVPVTAQLHVSIPEWSSNMTASKPPPASSPSAGPPKTRKAVSGYVKSLRSNPTTQSAGAAMSGSDQQPAGPGCTQQLQSLNLCGPQLHIALTKDFGAIPGEGPVASAGGVIAQMGAMRLDSQDEEAILEQLNSMAENNSGNAINISIPLIRYGESGGFSNARISVTGNMEDDIPDTYSSISPYLVNLANGGKVYPPNGEVIITEYTPHILRGTFNATLVSKEAAKKAEISSLNPALPTMGSVSGSFTVAAPWRGNGASPDFGPDSATMDGVRDDVMGIFLKIPEDMRGQLATARVSELCKLGFEPGQLEAMGVAGGCSSTGTMAANMPRCDCNCSNWEVIREVTSCAAECDAKWRIWSCGPYLETGLGELDAETLRYQAEAQQLDVPENVWMPWVLVFRDASPEIRAEMWKELLAFRTQQNPVEVAAQRAQIEQEQAQREQRASRYDQETLSYRDALQDAGYSEAEVKGLTEVFSASPKAMRRVYWSSISSMPD